MHTILKQLGGNKFLAMTGVKQLVDLGNGGVTISKVPRSVMVYALFTEQTGFDTSL